MALTRAHQTKGKAGAGGRGTPRAAVALAIVALLALASRSQAVQTNRWIHNTEADFSQGQNKNTVVTNLGDVKLAARNTVIGEMPEQATIIYNMQAVANGDVYLAAGPEARLLRRHGDKVDEVASLPGEQIFSLALDAKGALLVGISSGKSRIARLDGDKLQTVVRLDDVRYIWDMVVDGARIYVATGTPGRVLLVDQDKVAKEPEQAVKPAANDKEKGGDEGAKVEKVANKPKPAAAHADSDKHGKSHKADKDESKPLPKGVTELLSTAEENVLCLAQDKQGHLFAGTDTDGLIYRLTLKDNGTVAESYVLYNAGEPEIGSLLVMADGTLYAGTADADQARPGRLNEAVSSEIGRPGAAEAGHHGPPVHEPGKEPPKLPKPPDTAPPPQPVGPAKGKADDTGKNAHEKSNATKEAMPAPAPAAAGDDDSDDDGPEMQGMGQDTPAKPEALVTGRTATPLTTEKPLIASLPMDPIRRAIVEQMRQAAAAAAPQAPAPSRQRRPRPRSGAQPPGRPGGGPPSGLPGSGKEGNAIYKITPDGFVSEVFRESVMILKLADDNGRLLVATGNEGLLYRVDPAAGETTVLVDLDCEQIPSVLRMPDGTFLLGTANPATLVKLDAGYAKEGQYTSTVLDATNISLWGKMHVTAAIPDDTSVMVETRSGNVHDPEEGSWTGWAEASRLDHDDDISPAEPREMPIKSPAARFFQYRLKFKGKAERTPVVHRVEIPYLAPNLRPVINSITASYPDADAGHGSGGGGAPGPGGNRAMRPGPRPMGNPGAARGGPPAAGGDADAEPEPVPTLSIEWDASDPNNDRLKYTLEYEALGTDKWLPLAKDLDTGNYDWNTRRVPDGRYIVRVTASDAPDNPPGMALTSSRISDPVLVDNTPPEFEKLKVDVDHGTVTITGRSHDALSEIRSIHYAVDQTDKWQDVLPDSKMYDSTNEGFTIKIVDLSPGTHVVTLRTVDGRSNARYEARVVEVK